MKKTIAFLIFIIISSHLFGQKYAIVPIGDVRNQDVTYACRALEKFYDIEITILDQDSVLVEFSTNIDTIYSATQINNYLNNYGFEYKKIMGVTDVPLTINEFILPNMINKMLVRGYANKVGERCAVISTFKIKSESENADEFKFLLEKVSIHEFGHLLGLEHCENEHCLMVNGLKISDFKARHIQLCDSCQEKLIFLFRSDN